MGKNILKCHSCFLVTSCIESKTTGATCVTYFLHPVLASSKHCRPYLTFNPLKTPTQGQKIMVEECSMLKHFGLYAFCLFMAVFCFYVSSVLE